MRNLLAGAVASLAVANPASASPWNRIDGGVFVSTKIDYFSSSTAISRYYRLDTDNYIEWGVTPRLMAGGKVLYGQAWTENATAATRAGGVSEGAGFLQYQVRRNEKNALAIKLAAGFDGDALSGARPGASTGGEYLDARLLYGRDIIAEPVKIFVAAEAGYRARFGPSADQWRGDAQLGVEPFARLLLLAGAEATLATGGAPGPGDDFDIVKLSASAVWRASSRYSFIAGARKEIAARNIEPGTSVFLGLWTQF